MSDAPLSNVQIAEQNLPKPLSGFVQSLVRHWLTGLAGSLVTAGVLSASQSKEFVDVAGALALAGSALLWSWVEKQIQSRRAKGAVRFVAQSAPGALQDVSGVVPAQMNPSQR